MLAEDPRSVYRRNKCINEVYAFTLDNMSVHVEFGTKLLKSSSSGAVSGSDIDGECVSICEDNESREKKTTVAVVSLVEYLAPSAAKPAGEKLMNKWLDDSR